MELRASMHASNSRNQIPNFMSPLRFSRDWRSSMNAVSWLASGEMPRHLNRWRAAGFAHPTPRRRAGRSSLGHPRPAPHLRVATRCIPTHQRAVPHRGDFVHARRLGVQARGRALGSRGPVSIVTAMDQYGLARGDVADVADRRQCCGRRPRRGYAFHAAASMATARARTRSNWSISRSRRRIGGPNSGSNRAAAAR